MTNLSCIGILSELLPYIFWLAVIFFSGAFGGLVSGVMCALKLHIESAPDPDDDEACVMHNHRCEKLTRNYYLGKSIVGCAGAYAAILVYYWIGKVDFEVISPATAIPIVCLCVVAGTAAHRLVPGIGKRIEEELLNQKIEATSDEAKRAVQTSKNTRNYASAINNAYLALAKASGAKPAGSGGMVEVEDAIEGLKLIESEFPYDRTLHIYLGRLFRCFGKLDEAIVTLRAFITNLEHCPALKGSEMCKKDQGAAYFNIACYHTLKAHAVKDHDEGEFKRLKEETKAILKKSFELDPDNIEVAKTDDDLNLLPELMSELNEGSKK